MEGAARFILGALLIAVAVTVGASVLSWSFAPHRVASRKLRRLLGGQADACALSASGGRGLGVSSSRAQVALVRFAGDRGRNCPLHQVRGVELVLGGEVRARCFRGEGRRPLDKTPSDGDVTLRLILDDPQDPAFDVELWPPQGGSSGSSASDAAFREARAVFDRIEASLLSGAAGIDRRP